MKNIKLHIAAAILAMSMVPASAMAATTTGTLNVSAVFTSPTASINVAGPLSFGSALIDGAAGTVTASTTFDVVTANNVPYTVKVGLGLNSGLGKSRHVVNGVGDNILYDLTQASGAVWDGVVAINATGTGLAQTYTVNGSMAKPTLANLAGSYTDTVTITVTY